MSEPVEKTPTEKELHEQCETLKSQLMQGGQQIQGASAQINAMKQMLGEQLDTVMILRTNLGLVQQAHQAVSQEWEKAKAALTEAELKASNYLLENGRIKEALEIANKKIEELTSLEAPLEDQAVPDVA